MKQFTATLALSVKTLALDHHRNPMENLSSRLEVVGKMKHFRFSIDEIFYVGFRGKKHSVTITFRFKQGFPQAQKGEEHRVEHKSCFYLQANLGGFHPEMR